eukprot:g7545.t1
MNFRSPFRVFGAEFHSASFTPHTRPRSRLQNFSRKAKASTTQHILSKEDLVGYLASGCKTPDKFRIGTEHEKFGYNFNDNSRLDYSKIEKLLTNLQKRFGWDPILENDKIIGVKMDGQSVTLEPGGQFELSGAPLKTLHQTCAEVNSHLYQVKTISEQMNVGFVGIGHDPKWTVPQVPMMPKNRYKLMKGYMPSKGQRGHHMMFRTCTIQVNLDFESEVDMIRKFRVGLALQPIATALFANSPFNEGKDTGFLSWRSQVWLDTDPDRCGNLPFVFDSNFGFERYTDYALDVPMYFIYRPEKGGYLNALGLSFRDFMEGKCPTLPGEYPTLKDWEDHLTTIFPDVRLKTFLEMRGADGGPWKLICALPALWVGLLYDSEALDSASALTADWTQSERDYLYTEVGRHGLKTPFRGGTVLDVAKEMLTISRTGLERRGFEEASFLKELEQIAETGVTQAEILLQKFNGEWNHQVDPLYDACHY